MTGPAATRRLTAIVAADVAGYSRLIAADEEATLTALRAHRLGLIDPKITEYRGRIANTAGDSLLIEFPSVVNSLRYAIDVQRGMAERNTGVPVDRRIQFRIGINLGDVVEQDGDLLGDGVNVAARLEGLAEPGGICLSRAARDQVRDRLEVALEDMGEVEVKNLTRPVRVFRILQGGATAASRRQDPPRRARLLVFSVVLVILGLLAAGVTWWRPWAETTLGPPADKLSIVVLPFDNLSSDPEQAFFADAVTEDLITDLSRIRGAFVIARSTSLTYKNRALKAKEVAKELNVRYVLEGSVQRAARRVRVNAQLIDGKTGAHLWSEKFDRELDDTIRLQSEITGHIAAVLRAELPEAESHRPKRANLDAWDLALKGQVKLHAIELGPKVIPEAKVLFERALELDPKLALAWEGLAFIHFAAATRDIPGVTVPDSKVLSLEAARKAVSLDPKSSDAHTVLGLALFWNGKPESALASCQAAIELNRNNDDAYLCMVQAYRGLKRPQEAIPLLDISQRLNPRFRTWRRLMYLGFIKIDLGDYEGAVIALKKAKADFPTHQSVNLYLTAALALSGQLNRARIALSDYMKLATKGRDTIEKLRAERGSIDPYFDRVAQGLRLAGMPER